jgi:hypothetical protein
VTPVATAVVGRGREREALRAALASAVEGRGTAVAITGEAGIGKTMLALTVERDAVAAGARWLTGSGWAGGGAPAFWPWIQVIRGLADALDDDRLQAAMGLGAPYIAHLVPQLRGRLPDIAEPAELASDQARFSLFDAVTTFLVAAAADQPLVIVLDDLHAADASTLRLLQFLVQSLHGAAVLVLALHQETPHTEAGGLLAELDAQTQRMQLRGLDRLAVADLVAQQAPGADADRLAEQVHALTEGNPFFAGEVVRLMVAEGRTGADAPVRLPDGVRATIRRRLEPVSPATLEVLAVAAVIGMEFRVETLSLAAQVERFALLDLVDEAVVARVLVEVPREPDRYAFAHSLIRETLYADLTPSSRARLHGAVGTALEGLYGLAAEEHLSELSHHFFAAYAEGAAKAVDLSARAGHQALRVLAYEEADRHFGQALRIVAQEDPAGERACDLLLAQGDARMRGGRPAAAREALVQATGIARRLGSADRFARATLAMTPWGFNMQVSDDELAGLLGEALAQLDDGEHALRARLLSTLARTMYWVDDLDRRLEVAERAIGLARESGDDRTLARVLGDAHIATWNPDGNARSLAWADEMLAIAERTGDRQLALDGHSWRMALLLEGGDVAGVDAAFALAARMARDTNEPRALAAVRRHEASRALIAGDWALAQQALGESAQLSARMSSDEMAVLLVAALTFAISWHRDELEPLVGAVRQFADDNPEMPAWRCALAASLVRTGSLDEARRELAAVRRAGFAAMPRDNLWLVSLALAAEAVIGLGDGSAAAELAPLLEPYAGRNAVTPDGIYFGPVDRFRALLAHTVGDWDAALALQASARAAAQHQGAVPVLLQLDRDEARTLAASGGDPAPAQARAAARAQALGLRAAPEPAAAPVVARVASFSREGDYWRVAFAAEPFTIKDAKGLHHLVRLLAQPDVPLHVLELGAGGVARDAGTAGDAGAMLDDEAKAQYRSRRADLAAEIDEAESFNDPERATAARDELAFLEAELRSAVGLGGRDRKAASSAERARVNVTRQIRAAIERLAAHDGALGRHLEGTVRTGTFCVYRPEPGGPAWELVP